MEKFEFNYPVGNLGFGDALLGQLFNSFKTDLDNLKYTDDKKRRILSKFQKIMDGYNVRMGRAERKDNSLEDLVSLSESMDLESDVQDLLESMGYNGILLKYDKGSLLPLNTSDPEIVATIKIFKISTL